MSTGTAPRLTPFNHGTSSVGVSVSGTTRELVLTSPPRRPISEPKEEAYVGGPWQIAVVMMVRTTSTASQVADKLTAVPTFSDRNHPYHEWVRQPDAGRLGILHHLVSAHPDGHHVSQLLPASPGVAGPCRLDRGVIAHRMYYSWWFARQVELWNAAQDEARKNKPVNPGETDPPKKMWVLRSESCREGC
jgi:hypothetical protein